MKYLIGILLITCLTITATAKDTMAVSFIAVGPAKNIFNDAENSIDVTLKNIRDSIQKLTARLNASPDNEEEKIHLLKALGELNYNIGNNGIALHFIQTCIKEIVGYNLPNEQLTDVYLLQGKVYLQAGSIDKALSCYFSALNTVSKSQSLENEQRKAKIYCKMSTAFYTLKQLDKARRYASKTDSIMQIVPDANTKGERLLNQGVVLSESNGGSLISGLSYFKSALQLGVDQKINSLVFVALVNMGVNYYKLDSIENALICLKKAIAVKDFYNQFYFNAAQSTIGEIYYSKGDYKNAEIYLLRALKGGQEVGQKEIELYANEFLYKLNKTLGKSKNAILYMEDYYRLKLELEGKDINQNANELEIKYKSVEKDNEIANKNLLLLKQQSKIKSYTITLGSIIVMFLFVVLGFKLLNTKQSSKIIMLKKEQEINNLKAIIQGEEQERSRIAGELHDGIGAMVAAVKLDIGVLQNSNPQIKDLNHIMECLDDTSKEIRQTAHNLLPNAILNNSLREALIQYCNGLTNSLDITLQYEEETVDFKNDAKLILFRIFQELLQNIVKHANATKAFIQVRERNGMLKITVEDNGIGFEPNEIKYGLGLNNIKLRVKVLEGSLSIHASKDQGSTFFITFNQHDLRENKKIA